MADVSLQQALSAYTSARKNISDGSEESSSGSSSTALNLPGEGPNTMKPSFVELVGDSMKTSAAKGYEGEAISAKAIANEADLHELVATVSNAELTLNTVVAVRDRVISAYQDIIKMPI